MQVTDARLPIIDPLTEEEATARGLGEILATSANGTGDDVFLRTVGRVDGYAEALHGAMQATHFEGTVDHRLKEIIRIQLAETASDPYFGGLRSKAAVESGLTEERIRAGAADFESDDAFTEAEKWALRYAHLMYRDPGQLDADFYDEGRNHYSDAEIIEIGALVALHYGMSVFMRTWCVKPAPGEQPG